METSRLAAERALLEHQGDQHARTDHRDKVTSPFDVAGSNPLALLDKAAQLAHVRLLAVGAAPEGAASGSKVFSVEMKARYANMTRFLQAVAGESGMRLLALTIAKAEEPDGGEIRAGFLLEAPATEMNLRRQP